MNHYKLRFVGTGVWDLNLTISDMSPQVSPYLLPIILPLAQVSLTCSIFMTMSLSMERFLVVSNIQHQVRQNII